MRRRVVFTGPPGAGKTTLLAGMTEVGLPVVGEAAIDVIARRQSEGIVEPWRDLRFTELVVALQTRRQRDADRASRATVLFDRSPACTLALARYLAHPIGPLLASEIALLPPGLCR